MESATLLRTKLHKPSSGSCNPRRRHLFPPCVQDDFEPAEQAEDLCSSQTALMKAHLSFLLRPGTERAAQVRRHRSPSATTPAAAHLPRAAQTAANVAV